MTVSFAILRTHVETDLVDAALTRLIDDAVALCADRAPSGAQTIVMGSYSQRYLVLPQAVAAAADIAISERSGDETTVLALNTDWRWNGGRIVERLSGGSVVFWGHEYGGGDIVITYTPKADTARRDRIVIDLCKLAIAYNALGSERAGDYGSSGVDYTRERDRIVRTLVPMGVA